jgi:hypothetical protein
MRKTCLALFVAALAGMNLTSLRGEEKESPLGGLFRAVTTLLAPAVSNAEGEPAPAGDATHEQLKAVSVKGQNGASLQTLASGPDGKIVALVAPPRYGGVPGAAKAKPVSEIRVFDGEGDELAKWPLSFTAQSVAVGPTGTIYVAGDGKLARFDAEGKSLGEAVVPHLAEALGDPAKLREKAEQQLKQQIESFATTKKRFEEQLKAIQDKDPEKRTDLENRQLKSLEANVRAYEQISENYKSQSVETVMEQLTSRLRIINGITVTEKEVFIACGEMKGYGYAIWRTSLDFKDPKQVLGQIGGCCGQMDIQASGNDLFVAENTRHRVGRYDRDGNLVKAFGKKSRESEGDCFGGCCNPMNCRIGAGGVVYTAESEGVVKKWSADGEFLATVGVAKLTGGCKNVAVAASPKGDRVYFCDFPGSRIIILAEKAKKVEAAAGN